MQFYLPLKCNKISKIGALHLCIDELKSWLTNNSLNLNEGKTEVIFFGPSDAFNASTHDLGPHTKCINHREKGLGFRFDDGLKFEKQINGVVKS